MRFCDMLSMHFTSTLVVLWNCMVQERLQKELEAQQASIEAQLTAVTHQQVCVVDQPQSCLQCLYPANMCIAEVSKWWLCV